MAKNELFFSIVVPTLNEEKNLPQLFKTIREQTRAVPHQVIISDNGSTDKTLAVARQNGAQVVTGSRKSFIGHARQLGCQEAARLLQDDPQVEEVIINTDADCLLDKDYFASLVEAYSHPAIQVSTGPLVFQEGRRRLIFRKAFHPVALAIVATNLKAWWLLKDLHKTATLFGANTVIRRRLYNQVGGWDPDIHVVEDVDLGLKIIKKGFRINFLPGQVVYTSARKFFNKEGQIDLAKIIHYFFDHKMGIYHGQKLLQDRYHGGLVDGNLDLKETLVKKIKKISPR